MADLAVGSSGAVTRACARRPVRAAARRGAGRRAAIRGAPSAEYPAVAMYEPPERPEAPGSVIPLVLASQAGEGFAGGESMWLSAWGGQTLLAHALAVVESWGLTPGVVVLGAGADEIVDRVDFGDNDILIDPEWEEGEAASVRAGLDYIQRRDEVEAVVLTSADRAIASPAVVAELLQHRRRRRRPATAPKYRYALGRPIVIERELWPRLLGLEAGSHVEAILATHTQWVDEVWVDQLPPRRIVTPSDLSELAPRHGSA